MRPTLVCILALCASATLAVASEPTPPANAAPKNEPSVAPVDPRLEALKNVTIQRPARITSREEAEQLRQAAADVWLSQAEKLRTYRDDKAATAETRNEARHLEYIALLNAERAGNQSRKKQREALLQEIRSDQALPAAQRCQAVAMSLYSELQQNSKKQSETEKKAVRNRNLNDTSEFVRDKHDAQMLAFEIIERSLISEFPDAPNGYEGLLNIARDSNRMRANIIIEDLLGYENIPDNIRNEARRSRERRSLEGQNIRIFFPSPDEQLSGKELWIYSWSRAHPGSAYAVTFMRRHLNDDINTIGFCLDDDVEQSKVFALENQFSGANAYRERNEIAQTMSLMMLTEPGLLYIACKDGVIITTNGNRELLLRQLSGQFKTNEEAQK